MVILCDFEVNFLVDGWNGTFFSYFSFVFFYRQRCIIEKRTSADFLIFHRSSSISDFFFNTAWSSCSENALIDVLLAINNLFNRLVSNVKFRSRLLKYFYYLWIRPCCLSAASFALEVLFHSLTSFTLCLGMEKGLRVTLDYGRQLYYTLHSSYIYCLYQNWWRPVIVHVFAWPFLLSV